MGVIDESAFPVFDRGLDITKLDDALTALAQFNENQVRIVELRFFGGLSVDLIVDLSVDLSVEGVSVFLGVSERTVIRQWPLAKAWLAAELGRARP